MIKSFADKETEKLFRRTFSRKLHQNIQLAARMKLEILEAAEVLQDLRVPPGNRLERLSGDREGQHSIRINDQYPESGMIWRICFDWVGNKARNVEIVDYHG